MQPSMATHAGSARGPVRNSTHTATEKYTFGTEGKTGKSEKCDTQHIMRKDCLILRCRTAQTQICI